MLLKLMMHGEDCADKILGRSLAVLTQVVAAKESFHYPSSCCITQMQWKIP